MADYRQAEIAGTSWRRCCGIDIHNPYGKAGQATFREQDVALVGSQLVQLGAASLHVVVDMAKEFDIYDPQTLQPTGAKATHAQLYGLLFSAYMTEALARDASLIG